MFSVIKIDFISLLLKKLNVLVTILALNLLLLSCSEKKSENIVEKPIIESPTGNYKIGHEVTIRASNENDIIYYTLDGTTPTKEKNRYISPIKFEQEGIFTLKALSFRDELKSKIVDAIYTIEKNTITSNFTVHFKKPDSWSSSINVYYWDTTPESDTVIWPGELMNLEEDSWYSYTFRNISSTNLIFNDGVNQTTDLLRDKDGWYYNDIWYDYKPVGGVCENYSCQTDSHCEIQNSSPICVCNTGFHLENQICIEDIIDLCENYSCQSNSHCETQNNLPNCVCNTGFHLENDICVEIQNCNPECTEDQSCVNGVCVTTITSDFREETIYFIMTDRFSDGNSSNNSIYGDEYLPNGESQMYNYDESKTGILSYYHGGDFQGILNNLQYIKDMGFTAIWITPVIKQAKGRYYYGGEYQASAFHGYWAYDFDKIDPHLHNSGVNSDGWEDFENFINTLHENGIKLMLDIVTNHGHPDNSTSPSLWSTDNHCVIMNGREWCYESDPYKDSNDPSKGFFNYRGDYKLSALIDFNERGADGEDAREHLKAVYKKFIDAGVDAFRIDTIAYMTKEWWGEFSDEMYRYARSKGKDNFYMVGEGWMGRNDAIQRMQSSSEEKKLYLLDLQGSCMDYPGEMYRVFDGSAGFQYFTQVTEYGDSIISDPTYIGTFVDNHDVYRANGRFNEAQYKNALNYIYLFRGVPIVYYGTEAMYSWSGAYATTNKDDVCARWMLGENGINYVKNSQPPIYKHLKMLNSIRHSSTILQKGRQENILLQDEKAVIKRVYNNKSAYIGMTRGNSYTHNLTSIENGSYRKINPNSSQGNFSVEIVEITDGNYSLTVPENSFTILEMNN
ncbi:starch-binding protein [bacterium]|nr:starch-binding protein [bacterium]